MDRTLLEYETVGRERVDAVLRNPIRDRIVHREETVARILWRRDAPGEIELLGARQVRPVVNARVSLPSGLGGQASSLAFEPGHDLLWLAGLVDDGETVVHPLAAGAEAHYRYRSGDTTRIRLRDGRVVRVAELQVEARRQGFAYWEGGVWIDLDSHAPVRMVLRPSRPFDLALDTPDDDEIPGFLQPIRAEVRFLSVEYALWDGRWWLPRSMAFEAGGMVGPLRPLSAMIRYERSYGEFRVLGSPEDAAGEQPAPLERCPRGSPHLCRCTDGRCSLYAVTVPADTSSLLESPHFAGSIFDPGGALVTAREMEEIARTFDRLVRPTLGLPMAPVVTTEFLTLHSFRYGRVEGLGVSGRVEADFHTLAADLRASLGIPTWEAGAEVGVRAERFRRSTRLAAYRRLTPVPLTRLPGPGSSLSSLLLGRDDSDLYRATGADLLVRPPELAPQRYALRIFAERQASVDAGVDFSLRSALGGEGFRPNVVAEEADLYGASLSLRRSWGENPRGVRARAEAEVEGVEGDFRYLRPGVALGLGIPLPGGLLASLEGAGGTAWGELPRQAMWHLGGAQTVRGYAGAAAVGESYWRGRGEISTALPAARLGVFFDAGWAGGREELSATPALASVGVGAAFLDGLLRVDLAQGVRGPGLLRLDLTLER